MDHLRNAFGGILPVTDWNAYLEASADPGMPVHHPADFGRFDGKRLHRYATGTAAVGGPQTQIQESSPGQTVPFRRATTFRTAQLPTTSLLMTASAQQVDVVIEGSGFIFGIDLHVFATTAGNAATVAFAVDGPWSALDTVVFRDVNGELVNLSGIHLRLLNLYGSYHRYNEAGNITSADTANVYNAVTGAGATGGTFNFHVWVPIGVNRRTLLGILGNQDRAQKYSLRSDIAASGSVYSTPPTALATVNIERMVENYAVPGPQNAAGAAQQQFPDFFGVLHYNTQQVNAAVPIGGATINHYLPRLGNTLRLLILVLRSNGSRATAESNLPTRIQLNIGDTPIFVETPAYRRWLMFNRWGFDAPAGVFAYDWSTDIVDRAGSELGDDYIFTAGLVNAQFIIAYPAGFGSTNNSLTVLTEDLQIPPTVDIYR